MDMYSVAMTILCLLPSIVCFLLFVMADSHSPSEQEKKRYEEIYNEHNKVD